MIDSEHTDAGRVAAGPDIYRVTYVHGHKTLSVGDVVVMTETPPDMDGRYPGMCMINVIYRMLDSTLHRIADEHGQYVHLQQVRVREPS